MPALRTCAQAGCPALVPRGRCVQHERARRTSVDRNRGTATERGYGAAWRKIRAQVLAEEPLCQCPDHMGADDAPASTEVDHIIPKSRGGTDARSNLQGLAHACHSRKTAKEDGGFGNQQSDTPDLTQLRPSRIPVTIVAGAPGSGKSTYVQQHALPTDTVIDLDVIRAELSRKPIYHDTAFLGLAIEDRDRRLLALASDTTHTHAWFIITAPEAGVRQWWAKKLGAQHTIVLETPKATCLTRVASDPRRPAYTHVETNDAIERWWVQYARSSTDSIPA